MHWLAKAKNLAVLGDGQRREDCLKRLLIPLREGAIEDRRAIPLIDCIPDETRPASIDGVCFQNRLVAISIAPVGQGSHTCLAQLGDQLTLCIRRSHRK